MLKSFLCMSPTVPSCPSPVYRVVPYLHVANVEQSVAFYAALGFEEDGWYREPDGRAFWASVKYLGPDGAAAEVFFAKADAPVIPEQQAVILYMYSRDVQALRNHLLECGLHDGGRYCGQPGPNNGRRVVFEVYHPDHMKDGELRVADPDGYCLLVGQLGE